MNEIKSTQNYLTNIAILIVTLFSLIVTYQITSHNYKDNRHYREAYFLMNKHNLNIDTKYTSHNTMYYLIDSPWHSGCHENGHIKYYLLEKNKYNRYKTKSVIKDNDYYLLSCQDAPRTSLGVIHEKGYYLYKDRTLSGFLETYRTTIGGLEPIYIVLSYLSSSILDYNSFILLLNLIFLLVVFLALKKFTKNYKYMYILLVLFDFYFYIYLSNTHRLKLAIIFLLLSYLTHSKTKIIMTISALLSHLQISIVYLYYLIYTLIHDVKVSDIIFKKKIYGIYILLFFALGFFFQDQIINKINYYLHVEIPYKVIALIVMYLIYLFIFKLYDTIKLFAPLAIMIIIIAFLVGSNRVNFMLMEFILIVELNRLLNRNKYALFVVIPFLLYSLYKSIHYLQLGLHI